MILALVCVSHRGRMGTSKKHKRGSFRLHLGTRSLGCVTITDKSEWVQLKNLLENTSTTTVQISNSAWNAGWFGVPDTLTYIKYGGVNC